MPKRKSFSSEFKREAVRLLETSQKPPADLARELGVRSASAGDEIKFCSKRFARSTTTAKKLRCNANLMHSTLGDFPLVQGHTGHPG